MTSRSVLPVDSGREMEVLSVGGDGGATGEQLRHEDDQFSVETATGADEGLERLGTGRFDCVVSAYDLPDGDGVAFLETVREAYPDLPFILFTGNGSEAVASEAITAGATDYFRKGAGPDQHERLADRIRSAVRQYRNDRAEHRLLDLAEHTEQLFFVFSGDWSELLFASSAYEEIWSGSVAGLHDDPGAFLAGVHAEDRDRVQRAMETVSGGEPVEVEYRVDADGQSDRWVRIRCEPVVDERGGVVRIAGLGADITGHHRRRQRRERQRETLVDLATDDAVTAGNLDCALRRITETAADVLDVDRVNVWLADDDTLSCVDNYDRRIGAHTSDMELDTVEYPAYVEALETHRAIDATDARADPRTAELAGYLDDHDIGALLDGTLRSEGEVIGVICHEHVGERRAWSDDEIEFASDVAEIVHRALRNHERRQRQQELRRERTQFEQVLETSPVGITVLDSDGRLERANERAEEIFQLDPSEIAGRAYDEAAWNIFDENGEPVPDEELPFTRVSETGEPVYGVEHGIETGEGEKRWLSINSAPLPTGEDGEESEPKVLSVVKDITERHREEETLKTLQERTQTMARTEDREAIAGIAVETVDELLGFDGTVVYEFDGADRLVPLEWSVREASPVDDPPVATREGLLWDVFADGEEQFVEDVGASDRLSHTPLRSALVLPVGNHGVLLTGTATPSTLSSTARNAAHLICDSLDAALDRAARERRLRERDRTLQRRNEQLEQLNRLNAVIRETTAAVIQSSSRTDIESRVCERIAADAEYSFAWFGGWDAVEERLEVNQWAEMDPEYVEFLGSPDRTTPLHEMVAAAVRDGSVQVAGSLLERGGWKRHRRDLLNQGYRSVAVVPVTVRGHTDSVLVIHGVAADLFDDREKAVLKELGDAIGYAIQNVDHAGTLGTRTEVEVGIADERLFSNQIGAALGTDVSLVGAVPGDGETVRTFLRFAPLPDGAEETLRELTMVANLQPLADDGETGLYQVTIERPHLIRSLQASDARLEALSVEDGTTTVTALLTGDTPVRSLVEELRTTYPDTELRARRESAEPVDTRETFRDRILDQLTEKQLDALQTALYGGFYEWPRTSTREELAATRDIASSTFSHHLRAAERKVLSTVLEST